MNKNTKIMKRISILTVACIFVLTSCLFSVALADEGFGGGMNGAPSGQSQQSGPSSNPGQSNPSGKPNQSNPNGQPNQSNPNGQPNQNTPSSQSTQNTTSGQPNQINPNGQPNQSAPNGQPRGNGPDMMAIESYLSEDGADSSVKAAYDALKQALASTPDGSNSEDIATLEKNLEDAIESAGIELTKYAQDLGLDYQAIETYLSSEDADENVQTAYDALKTALADNTDDKTEEDTNNLSDLETALKSAMETAGLNVDDYTKTQPDNMQTAPNADMNLKAVESYLSTDDADSSVQTAYDALKAALSTTATDGTDSDISALETALESALEAADVDLDDYTENDVQPDNNMPKMEVVPNNPNSNENSNENTNAQNNIFQSFLNKLLSLFQ